MLKIKILEKWLPRCYCLGAGCQNPTSVAKYINTTSGYRVCSLRCLCILEPNFTNSDWVKITNWDIVRIILNSIIGYYNQKWIYPW